MNKNNKQVVLCTDDADTVAKRLKRHMGFDKAHRIASGFSQSLTEMGPGDVLKTSSLEYVRKQGRFWTQVANILRKSK